MRRISLLFLLLVSCAKPSKQVSVPYYNTADFTPVWIANQDTLHKISAFSFINQNNERITEITFKDKVYLTDFIFISCPSICPKMTKTMKLVHDHFSGNRNVLFLSHSVTPERDSPSVLKRFAKKMDADDSQWHFVTGNKTDIYNIARRSYFIEQRQGLSKDSTQFLHSENLILIDKNSHLRGLYNGTLPVEANRIIEDISFLLKE